MNPSPAEIARRAARARDAVLAALEAADGREVSFEALGAGPDLKDRNRLAAQVRLLRLDGHDVRAVRRRGYHLAGRVPPGWYVPPA